jgi:HlyD family secretion protein
MSIEETTASTNSRGPPPEPRPSARSPGWRGKSTGKMRRLIPVVLVMGIMASGAAGAWYWWQQQKLALPAGFAKANGRLEAEQVEIATKLAGRIAVVLVKEGQMVDAGQVVARMDTTELEAQLQAAEAQVSVAEHQKTQAEAAIVQQDSNRTYANQELERAATLYQKGSGTKEKLDQARNQSMVAQAAYDTAVAGLHAAKATIAADRATVAQIQSRIDDSTLVAPRRGRIQYKLAQPGEVLAAGGRVLTLLDLSDIYMTIFLPSGEAGRLVLDDGARVVVDPLPEYVIPAKVTFIAAEAQFTPKTVETAVEREKLMFRVKLSIDPDLVERYQDRAKTGVRGVGYVRTRPNAVWPNYLAVKLPQ